MGRAGWIGVRLAGRVDWDEGTALVRRSFTLVAPKRIARMLPEG
jgi:predicted DNA-binding protein (MmcQ/YjbR family)